MPLGPKDALIVVDMQRCFEPQGSLPVEGGDRVVPVINKWIEQARRAGARIVASRDFHPPGHTSFQDEGGDWPEHCVQDTPDADLDPNLKRPPEMKIVTKGHHPGFDQYSAFDRTGLGDELRDQGVERIWVGGLAQDVCVRQTVLDGIKEGFETHLIQSATRPVDPEEGRRAIEEMEEAGAIIEDGAE
jgi:nicotinamidase/pyrazinamidase